MKAEFPENYNLTVEQLEGRFIGDDFEAQPLHAGKRHWNCDWCSAGVSLDGGCEGGMYLADDILGGDYNEHARRIHRERPLVTLSSYGPECRTRRLLFPCQGYMEVRAYFELDEDAVVTDYEVTDVSPRNDGIPWNPEQASTEITEQEFETVAQMLFAGEGHLWGPENMVTFFDSVGIDPREFINWDGSLDRKRLGAARKKYQQFQQEMAKEGHDREAFRDRVRGDDDGN